MRHQASITWRLDHPLTTAGLTGLHDALPNQGVVTVTDTTVVVHTHVDADTVPAAIAAALTLADTLTPPGSVVAGVHTLDEPTATAIARAELDAGKHRQPPPPLVGRAGLAALCGLSPASARQGIAQKIKGSHADPDLPPYTLADGREIWLLEAAQAYALTRKKASGPRASGQREPRATGKPRAAGREAGQAPT